jgi:hypothetical protein
MEPHHTTQHQEPTPTLPPPSKKKMDEKKIRTVNLLTVIVHVDLVILQSAFSGIRTTVNY